MNRTNLRPEGFTRRGQPATHRWSTEGDGLGGHFHAKGQHPRCSEASSSQHSRPRTLLRPLMHLIPVRGAAAAVDYGMSLPHRHARARARALNRARATVPSPRPPRV